MTLFIRLRIFKNSVDKKCKFVTLSQNHREKKSSNPAVVAEGVLQVSSCWFGYISTWPSVKHFKKKRRKEGKKEHNFPLLMWTLRFIVFLVYLKLPVLKGFWVNKKWRIRCEISKSLGSFHRIFLHKGYKIPCNSLAALQMMDKQP